VIGANHKPKVVGSVGDPKELQKQIKKEDWNEYHITARGNHLVQAINGHVTVDVTDEDKGSQGTSGPGRPPLLASSPCNCTPGRQ